MRADEHDPPAAPRRWGEIPTQFCTFVAVVDDASRLCELWFGGGPPANAVHDQRAIVRVTEQLTEYAAGTRTTFDLPLAPHGSAFQLRVWEALRRIPYGETTSYGAIARELGDPRLSRAVGSANGSNPIPVVIPCHRVIGADGTLTGFGGGLPLKESLLRFERDLVQGALTLFPNVV